MNCRQAERRIYLYTELSVREKEQTNRHISACAQCARLFETVKAQRIMVVRASRLTPELPDVMRMTRSIMESIQERQHRKQGLLSGVFQMRPMEMLRYSMAMISFMLLSAFVAEYNSATELSRPYKAIPMQPSIELNSASFYAGFVQEREADKNTGTFFYQCIVNCLYTPGSDCKRCQGQIAKLN